MLINSSDESLTSFSPWPPPFFLTGTWKGDGGRCFFFFFSELKCTGSRLNRDRRRLIELEFDGPVRLGGHKTTFFWATEMKNANFLPL